MIIEAQKNIRKCECARLGQAQLTLERNLDQMKAFIILDVGVRSKISRPNADADYFSIRHAHATTQQNQTAFLLLMLVTQSPNIVTRSDG